MNLPQPAPAFESAAAPATPPRRSRTWLVLTFVTAGVLTLACCLGGTLLYILGKVGNAMAANDSASAAAASAAPMTTAPPAAPTPTTLPTVPPTVPVAATALAPTKTTAAPPKADYSAVAAIVRADNTHYRQQVAAGKAAFNTPAFAPWYQAITKDQRYSDDWDKAEGLFTTASPEPPSFATWYADINRLATDINQWANAALFAEPGPADDKMATFASRITTELGTVDRDADNVAAGR